MKYETQLFGGQTNLHCMKQILHNAKSNSHGCIRLAICIATAFAVVMLTACSDGNGTKSFHSSDEAIREYHGFLTTLRQNGKVSIQTLVKIVNEWRVLDDSVTSCISRDTVRKAHSYPFTVYHELNDSIHIELCRMAMSKQRTFHDLLYLREQTSSHVGDEELQQAVKEAQPFFASLDSLPIYNKGGKQAVLKRYLLFTKIRQSKAFTARKTCSLSSRKSICISNPSCNTCRILLTMTSVTSDETPNTAVGRYSVPPTARICPTRMQ
ncbi:MAG: hypothetical protein ACLS35_01085 [Odoribacter splanchnicus]